MTTKDIVVGAFLLIAGCGLIAMRGLFSRRVQGGSGVFSRANSRHPKAAGSAPMVIGGFLIILSALCFAGVLSAQ
ncbi:hypothetical protein [Streptomyces sp. NPDC054865]